MNRFKPVSLPSRVRADREADIRPWRAPASWSRTSWRTVGSRGSSSRRRDRQQSGVEQKWFKNWNLGGKWHSGRVFASLPMIKRLWVQIPIPETKTNTMANSLRWSKKNLFICEILENPSTEKVTTRCLHFTTSLVLYKQKLSMALVTRIAVTHSDRCWFEKCVIFPKRCPKSSHSTLYATSEVCLNSRKYTFWLLLYETLSPNTFKITQSGHTLLK